MKKLISMSVLLLMIFSLNTFAFANDETTESTPVPTTRVTQFDYIVVDKDGNVVETGTTPDFRTRYAWSGITLETNESIFLLGRGRTTFYLINGTQFYLDVSLNRAAGVRASVSRTSMSAAQPNGGLFGVEVTSMESRTGAFTLTDRAEMSTYFFPIIRNASSDPVTITSAEFIY